MKLETLFEVSGKSEMLNKIRAETKAILKGDASLLGWV